MSQEDLEYVTNKTSFNVSAAAVQGGSDLAGALNSGVAIIPLS